MVLLWIWLIPLQICQFIFRSFVNLSNVVNGKMSINNVGQICPHLPRSFISQKEQFVQMNLNSLIYEIVAEKQVLDKPDVTVEHCTNKCLKLQNGCPRNRLLKLNYICGPDELIYLRSSNNVLVSRYQMVYQKIFRRAWC